jgi:hypothetical protein
MTQIKQGKERVKYRQLPALALRFALNNRTWVAGNL